MIKPILTVPCAYDEDADDAISAAAMIADMVKIVFRIELLPKAVRSADGL
jgi:hypothetical protein